MYRLLGIERQVAPGGRYGDKLGWATSVAKDSAPLVTVPSEMERWLAAGQRYAAVLALQSSHGPWADPVADRTVLSALSRAGRDAGRYEAIREDLSRKRSAQRAEGERSSLRPAERAASRRRAEFTQAGLNGTRRVADE